MPECMISAPQPEAVEAGLEVYKAGGNVMDAAIAAAMVQTVVDPQMCGIAGFGAMQIMMPENGVNSFVDFVNQFWIVTRNMRPIMQQIAMALCPSWNV